MAKYSFQSLLCDLSRAVHARWLHSYIKNSGDHRTRHSAGIKDEINGWSQLRHDVGSSERRGCPGTIGTRRGDRPANPHGELLANRGGWPAQANAVTVAQ